MSVEFDYQRLRDIRQEKGFSLQTLADACDVSASLISQVERGRVVPTLTTFWKICEALNVQMHDFFDKQMGESRVVRKDRRKTIQFPGSHVQYQLLSPHLQGQIEFLLVEISPGKAHDPEGMVTHNGEECGYILSGELIIRLGSEELHLYEGDSICFPSSTPHRFVNPGEVTSRSIWAMTPPSF